jgi:hypothetical protein
MATADAYMAIRISYTMAGRRFDHLKFKRMKLARKWLRVLLERGATNIRIS